jgi:Zn-dependent M28 family amino/carboxypeptidase
MIRSTNPSNNQTATDKMFSLSTKQKRILFSLAVIVLLFGTVFLWVSWPRPNAKLAAFDGQRAYRDVIRQVEFGPRIPDTEGHTQIVEYIRAELQAAGWQSEVLEDEFKGQAVRNIRAWRVDEAPVILLGAHYDTRIYADNDPDPENHQKPVPGANDGASGVAVLLEIARTLPGGSVPVELAFFDAEDNGRIAGWDWILGSSAYAASMQSRPGAVVIVDMIGDADLDIYMEHNSDPALTAQIWDVAKSLGYEHAFIPQPKYRVLDDHLPFIEKGLKAVDIIDLDYPYWHTIDDTPDKVSAQSLEIVGKTLLAWLAEYGGCIAQDNCAAK